MAWCGAARPSSSKRLREAAEAEPPSGGKQPAPPRSAPPRPPRAPRAGGGGGGMQELLDALNRRVVMAQEHEMKRGLSPRGRA